MLAVAEQKQERPARAPVAWKNPVQDKNFYLLSLLERTPDAHEAVKHNPALARIHKAQMAALEDATAAGRAGRIVSGIRRRARVDGQDITREWNVCPV